LPAAVPCAGLHAVSVLAERGLRDLADDAALVVSELVTNAVTASAALPARPPVLLHLTGGKCPCGWKSTTAARWNLQDAPRTCRDDGSTQCSTAADPYNDLASILCRR
jgi:hypothetical protein